MKSAPLWACLLLSVLAGCEMAAEPALAPQGSAPALSSEPSRPTVARGLLHFNDGYRQALAEAERENKPLLLFFTAQWCHYCHQMAGEAFTNPQVVSLSEKFVCVLIDADNSPDVCREFHVSAFPTVQFVSPQGLPLNRIEGKRPGHQVMMAMQAALQTAALRNQPNGPVLR
ncbi:MAG TPA: thioredoxin family protein [Pirellulales bacterium]|jgi:thiol:disulfide interchange protein|nr:thioredoxin family protein [Pirellulales bacterium]